jgi:hypothetical protein
MQPMYRENKLYTPALFISYLVMAAFILLNYFLAILNDSFVTVKLMKNERARKVNRTAGIDLRKKAILETTEMFIKSAFSRC